MKHIIDTDKLEKVLNKYEGTSGWAAALCEDLRALFAISPQVGDVQKDLKDEWFLKITAECTDPNQ